MLKYIVRSLINLYKFLFAKKEITNNNQNRLPKLQYIKPKITIHKGISVNRSNYKYIYTVSIIATKPGYICPVCKRKDSVMFMIANTENGDLLPEFRDYKYIEGVGYNCCPICEEPFNGFNSNIVTIYKF